MNLSGLLNNVKSLDFEEIVLGSAMENDNFIVDLNTEQLRKGINSDGNTLQPELASDEYARAKKAQGGSAPFGVPDLFDTGDFHSSFYAEREKDGIKVIICDNKLEAEIIYPDNNKIKIIPILNRTKYLNSLKAKGYIKTKCTKIKTEEKIPSSLDLIGKTIESINYGSFKILSFSDKLLNNSRTFNIQFIKTGYVTQVRKSQIINRSIRDKSIPMKKLSKKDVAYKYRQGRGWIVSVYNPDRAGWYLTEEKNYWSACALVREVRNSYDVKTQAFTN